jgi:mono/diheme cytochrome c family protein
MMDVQIGSLCGVAPMIGLTAKLSRIMIAAWLVSVAASPAFAAITADQRAKVAAVGRDLAAVEALVKVKKYREAAAGVEKAHAALAQLIASGDAELLRTVEPLKKRLVELHTTLSLEGIALAPLKLERPPITKPAGKKPAVKKPSVKKPVTTAPAKTDGSVSFVKQVAPTLVAKCSRCHIDDAKGKFSMATFAALRKGSEAGVVFFPRKSQGSRIVEVIETGDMPRAGGKVTKDELAVLAKWIDEGAMFDGPNLNAPLKQLVGNVVPAAKEQPKLEIVQATGQETSSYARDVASIIAAKCLNCHGTQQPRANFSMADFARFLSGGTSGPPIVPGKPAESLLIRKLRGQAGDRMPLRQPPLADDVIAGIEKWIAEGAKFDGGSPQSPTEQVVALYIAQHASHEELSAKRAVQAQAQWRLALPGDDRKPTVVQTDALLLLGTFTDAELKEIAAAAEKQTSKIANLMRAPADKPLVKGRVTLYAFDKRYDYSEFGQMVEKRQLPPVWRGHWKFDVVSAYACIVVPRNDEHPIDNLLAQQLSAVYVASQGNVPRWFAEGAGRAIAAAIDPRDKRTKAWDGAIGGILAAAPAPDAFTGTALAPEEADILAYGFVRDLRPTNANFRKLLESLRSGAPFDRAFAQVYRTPPQQAAQAWGRRAAGRGK